MMRIRLRLNADFSGPHAWFFLAQERGYFRSRGLELELLPGEGAAAIVPGIGADGVQAGYGDLNALAELASRKPGQAPVGVFQTFNRVPFTIAVRADGPVRSVADLRGRRVIGKPDDAAMLLFPTLADACGIAPASVQVAVSHLPMGEQVRDGLMVTRRLLDQSPEAVRALVEGLNQGVYDTVADIDAGMAALARAAPGVNVAVQRRRLQGTLDIEMAHPEGARIGIGDVDDARLQRGIAHMARTLGWASAPSAAEVFRRDFLPPLEERVRSLVR